MVDAISAAQPPKFTTIKYTTKDGENITATKNNGVVTLNGDKNGVRQMPIEDFKKELVATLPQTKLEKSPAKDTVEISKPAENKAPVTAPNAEAPKADKKEDKAVPTADVKDAKPAEKKDIKADAPKKLDVAA